jgi:hypothetical protein
MATFGEAVVCETYTERQVAAMAEELDLIRRRDELILLGLAIFTWVVAATCYTGVGYWALHGNGPLTTASVCFGTLIGGWGVLIFKTYRKRRARRRRARA